MTMLTRALGAALAALIASNAFAADNYVVKDATATTITMKSKDTGSGVQSPTHTVADSSGTIIDPAKAYTAAASGTVAVSAGTNKPGAIDLFSSQSVLIKDSSGNAIDFSASTPVTQSGTWTSVGIQGLAASGASFAANPVQNGCRAASAAPTAVTDGQVVAELCSLGGSRIVTPYAIKEVQVRGSTGAITNTTQTSIIASAGGSLKNYITAIQCANSGASTSILTFTDAAATVLINPAGGGGSWTFPVPLVTAAATAFQVTPGTASTSQYCSAQGFAGS